ncbi:MAG: hypothetical protein V5B35_19600 [Candidatus Accumulibacter necessarius]
MHDGFADVHSFLRYAEYWFERHITDEDKPFAACRLRERPAVLPASLELLSRSSTSPAPFSEVCRPLIGTTIENALREFPETLL